MRFEKIVEILNLATGWERPVTITTTDSHRLVGIPTSVDSHPAALEVFLHPIGDEATEISIPLTQITEVEFA
jgi:hypothetical protein